MVATKSGVLQRTLATDQAIPQTVIQAAIVFAIDVTASTEPPNLSGEFRGELGDVEPVDDVNTARPRQELVVEHVHVVPEDGHQPHARDHHPLLRIRLSLRSAQRAPHTLHFPIRCVSQWKEISTL